MKENQVSDCITFILTGSFRIFKKLNHGELTIKFFVENNWIADLESLLTQQPSKNYIEAIEDSEIASYLGMTPETLSRVRARIK